MNEDSESLPSVESVESVEDQDERTAASPPPETPQDRKHESTHRGTDLMHRLKVLWRLFGQEAVAVSIGLLELVFIALSLRQAVNTMHDYEEEYVADRVIQSRCRDFCPDTSDCDEYLSNCWAHLSQYFPRPFCNSTWSPSDCYREVASYSPVRVNATIFVALYSLTVGSLQNSLPWLKHFSMRNIGATPLSLEWQPGRLFDSFSLSMLMFTVGLASIISSVTIADGGDSRDHQTMEVFTAVLGAMLVLIAAVFGIWVFVKRDDLQTGGPSSVPFLGAARTFALSWELWSAIIDISYIPFVAQKSDSSSAVNVILLLLELLRSIWEVSMEARGMKLCYAFKRLYVPVSARDKLLALNTTRREAVNAHLTLDGVTLVTTRLCSSRELVQSVMDICTTLTSGPISGGHWYRTLGNNERPCRWKAWLAIQPVADSEKAWFDGEQITLNFHQLCGVTLSAPLDSNACSQVEDFTRVSDTAGRIVETVVWH